MVARETDSDTQQKQQYPLGVAVEDNDDTHQSPEEAVLVSGHLQKHVHGRHTGTRQRWSLVEFVCEHMRGPILGLPEIFRARREF